MRLTREFERAEVGYWIGKPFWGRGYATEMLWTMRELAMGLGVLRLSALCHPEHRASLRVMEKCGFSREGVLRRHAQFPNLAPGVAADVVAYATVFDAGWQPLVI